MNNNTSLYIDILRIAAAFAVLLGHAHGYILPGLPRILSSHADEGVAVFFVLSGFVIRFVLTNRENSLKYYFNARFVRIFSVVPIALIVTYASDAIGRHININNYDIIPWYNTNYFYSMIRSLTFTNELWGNSITFGSNQAYWSLGFEVQYYIVYGITFFLSYRVSFICIVIWSLFVGPIVSIYLFLWIVGVITYDTISKYDYKCNYFSFALFIVSIIIYVVSGLFLREHKRPITMLGDINEFLISYIYYMTIGFAVMINIISMNQLLKARDIFDPRIKSLIRWIAGGTFTLYLVHQPLLTLARAIIPDYDARPGAAVVALIVVTLTCFCIAELGERRKIFYKRAFDSMSKKIL